MQEKFHPTYNSFKGAKLVLKPLIPPPLPLLFLLPIPSPLPRNKMSDYVSLYYPMSTASLGVYNTIKQENDIYD